MREPGGTVGGRWERVRERLKKYLSIASLHHGPTQGQTLENRGKTVPKASKLKHLMLKISGKCGRNAGKP